MVILKTDLRNLLDVDLRLITVLVNVVRCTRLAFCLYLCMYLCMYLCLRVCLCVCRDCLATVCVNSCTSLFSGFVIFSYLGYMSARDHKQIDDVAADGTSLILYLVHSFTYRQQ